MKMVGLKRSKKDKEQTIGSQDIAENAYPYGTELRFERPEVEKLPKLKGLKKGDKVTLVAEAFVRGVSTRQVDGRDDEYTVTIQLEKVGVTAGTTAQPGSSEQLAEIFKKHEGKG